MNAASYRPWHHPRIFFNVVVFFVLFFFFLHRPLTFNKRTALKTKKKKKIEKKRTVKTLVTALSLHIYRYVYICVCCVSNVSDAGAKSTKQEKGMYETCEQRTNKKKKRTESNARIH